MAKWHGTEAMSLDKEKSKRKMIYYASPYPETYGYFSSIDKNTRDQYLKERNG